MPRGRLPNPNTPQEKSKRELSLSRDFQIIRDLVIVMRESGWNQISDKFTIIFEKEEARLFYSRRSGSLQLYWVRYGHQQITAPLEQFKRVEDIIQWMDMLYQIELQSLEPDQEEETYVLADLDPLEIIARIFE
jgi:hypothetical protein